jgi:cytochrome c2
MGSFRSVNLIIALVWLYFGFTASVLFNEMNKPNTKALDNRATERAEVPSMSAAAKLGKPIFKNNCASCHNKNMTTDLTGPALKGVLERWADYPILDLYSWVRNSDKLTEAKHPRALELKKEWNNDKMTSFTHLSDEEIRNLIEYIER